jgi:DNA invertase Pin-like site-specific DNA recombinase
MTSLAKPLRAVRYIRVSRADQVTAHQADETAALIDRRGWALVDTFLDHGVSGTRDRRPELDRLLGAARRREFEVVVVQRSDRFFRSLRHMLATLDELAALDVGFVSATEVFDTMTAQGRLVLQIAAAFAEFERNLIADRVRSSLAASRRRGVRLGRPPVHVDVCRALVLRSEGKSLRVVARDLGVGVATLVRALQGCNPPVPQTSLSGHGQVPEETSLDLAVLGAPETTVCGTATEDSVAPTSSNAAAA